MLLPIIIVADLITIYSVVDVITTFLFLLLLAYIVRWQMLLPLYVVDGNHILFVCNAGRCYCLGGRWNNHPGWVFLWKMLYPWWHMELPLVSFISILVLICSTEPHPICVADGTCQHFYSGMGY